MKKNEQKEKKRLSIRTNAIAAGGIAAALLLFIGFYLLLIPLNPHDMSIWLLTIITIVVSVAVYKVVLAILCASRGEKIKNVEKKNGISSKILVVPAVLVAVVIILGISGSKLFHASRYASVLSVKDAVFEKDLAETLNTDSIALMDTQSAQMLGDREIGSLSNVVSQYNVSEDYTQIDFKGAPQKVSALEYAGFFKWYNNKKEGVPGYVTVDPVSMSADYQTSKAGMIYVPSAYFAQDAARYIWRHYPTALTGNLHFEIDESGNPFYIATVYKTTISMFGGVTVKGAIVLNPINGDLQYYDLADVPKWIDVVYDGDTICTQYNWYGRLQNGFRNSIFGKKGCKQVTTYRESDDEDSNDSVPDSDYGYVAKDGDIWIYTGVTSVNGDSSNIGFLLANERSGESHYYEVSGADENSAMSAAEGEVQEKGYQASFPSLINVDGEPTYIMVLKDASGLVKLYAAVNVKQYNLVATASRQKDCIEKYRTLIGTSDSQDGADADQKTDTSGSKEPTAEKDVTIADIKYIDIDGNTWIYLITEKEMIYKAKVSEHEDMLLLNKKDQVHLVLHGQEMLSCKKVK